VTLPAPSSPRRRIGALLGALLVSAGLVFLCASPAGAEPVEFDIVSGEGSESIGTFANPVVVTVVPGAGNAFILASGDAPDYDNATTEERAAFCSVISRTVISGTAYLAGCSGDPIPAAEGQPVGFTCVGPSTCEVEFSSTVTAVSLIGVDVPAEFGGTSYLGTVTEGEPLPTTTTSSTTTSSTTTTVVETTTTVDPSVLVYESTERLNGRVTVAMGMASIGSVMIFVGVVALALRTRHA
jgi:hypothetical protein